MVSCRTAVVSISPGSKKSLPQLSCAMSATAPKRRRAHARQTIQPRKQLLIEPHQSFVFVSTLLRLQSEEQKVLLIEAQVDAFQIVKRADEQTRANQQQQRERDLRHDQPFAQAAKPRRSYGDSV